MNNFKNSKTGGKKMQQFDDGLFIKGTFLSAAETKKHKFMLSILAGDEVTKVLADDHHNLKRNDLYTASVRIFGLDRGFMVMEVENLSTKNPQVKP
jgi:hypothetical protein